MAKLRVLFVCVRNSARSQMAEELANRLCGECVEAQSAGLEPGSINPLAVHVMREIGVDIAQKQPRSVFELAKPGASFDHVITVCDEASAQRCPTFPGAGRKEHWSFPDPASFAGSWDERMARTREVRDAIEAKIASWCAEICAAGS